MLISNKLHSFRNFTAQILENENQDEILSLAGSRLSKPRS